MTTMLMGVFDGTMINVALPSIAQAVQVSASTAVWFANGYLLATTMTLALFAALAARLGYRPVFLAGLMIFTLTSLCIAPAILRSVFPGRLLGRVLGLHALLIASSSALGPVLGGTLLHILNWKWLFAVNVIPGAVALLFMPWPLGIVLIAPHAGQWADTISAPPISTLGLMIFAVGLGLLATLPASPAMWDICLRCLMCGIGFGCFQSPNNREMLSNVNRDHASFASGVLSIMRTFGQCLGAAVVGVMLTADARPVHAALWIATAASAGTVFVSVSRLRSLRLIK